MRKKCKRIYVAYYLFFALIASLLPVSANSPTDDQILSKIPSGNFHVMRSHQTGGAKNVILIEDLHCNVSAQKNIASILSAIAEKDMVFDILTEGSSGAILTQFYASFPILRTRKKVSDELLYKGLISGEEYFSITSGNTPVITGIDDPVLYRLNKNQFRDVLSQQEAVGLLMAKLETAIRYIKQNRYNSALDTFDKTVDSYTNSAVSINALLADCFAIADKSSNAELYAFYELLQKQEQFNYAALDRQVTAMVQYVVEQCGADYARTAVSIVTNPSRNTLHYKQLVQLAEQCIPQQDMAYYTAIKQYGELIKQFEQFSMKSINDAITVLIEDCYERLMQTDEERAVHRAVGMFSHIKHLFTLSLSRSEYNALFETDVSFESIMGKIDSLFDADSSLRPLFLQAEPFAERAIAFYMATCRRDMVLSENIIDAVNNSSANIVVAICGGFHTEHISKVLEENGISYCVIRPVTTDAFDFSLYASAVLRSELSLIPEVAAANLRASSFFAQNSFDTPEVINEFRAHYVFRSILDALEDFTVAELHSVVKQWRASFANALRLYYDDSAQVRTAMAAFDRLVTDLLLSDTVILSRTQRTLELFYNGDLYHLEKQPFGSLVVNKRVGVPRGDAVAVSMSLDVVQKEAATPHPVFIVSSVLNDPELSESYIEFDSAVIRSLNAQGIRPNIILPYYPPERAGVLNRLKKIISSATHDVQYVVHDDADGGGYIIVDENGMPLAMMPLSLRVRPVILQIAPSQSGRVQEQTAETTAHFSDYYAQMAVDKERLPFTEPFFMRIYPPELSHAAIPDTPHSVSVYFGNGLDIQHAHAIDAGIPVDAELLSVIKKRLNSDRQSMREDVQSMLFETTSPAFQAFIAKHPLLNKKPLRNMQWIVHDVQAFSNRELTDFYTALGMSGEPQVVFTFLADRTEMEKEHRLFLQEHTAYFDAQNFDNTSVKPDSKVVVINIPRADYAVKRFLYAVSDAVFASEPKMIKDALLFNKFGFISALLFRFASPEQAEIARQLLAEDGMPSELAASYFEYAVMKDSLNGEPLDVDRPPTPTAHFLASVLYNPSIQTAVASHLGRIIPADNAFNSIPRIIAQIDLNTVADSLLKRNSSVVRNHAARLLDAFFLDPLLAFDLPEGQQQFIEAHVFPFIASYIRQQTSGVAPRPLNDMKNDIETIFSSLLEMYDRKLERLAFANADAAVESLRIMLNSLVNDIHAISGEHLFVPAPANRYLYFYTDNNRFNPDPVKQNSTAIHEGLISRESFGEIADQLIDIETVNEILSIPGVLDFDRLFEQWNDASVALPGKSYVGYIATYNGSSEQKNALKNDIAVILLEQMRGLLSDYTPLLESAGYSVPTLESLHLFIETLYTDTSTPLGETSRLLQDFNTIIARITTFRVQGHTQFFRGERQWRPIVEQYLSDIIPVKIASGDFSVTVASIGASYGKEAYSIAAVIDRSLKMFAEEQLFADVPAGTEKERRIQEWIDLWDITIHAYEIDIQKLVILTEGVYTVTDYAYQDFTVNEILPEFNSIIADSVLVSEIPRTSSAMTEKQYRVQVNPRYKRWVRPHYFDFSADTAAGQLSLHPAEITFGLNFLPYIDFEGEPTPSTVAFPQVVKRFRSMLAASRPSEYKSVGIFNIKFQDTPQPLNQVDGQNYVLPPKTIPGIDVVHALSQYRSLASAEDIARIFGIQQMVAERLYLIYSGIQSAAFEIGNSAGKTDGAVEQILSSFLNTVSPLLLEIEYPQNVLSEQLSAIKHLVQALVRSALQEQQNQQTASEADVLIETQFGLVTILSNNGLIIPDTADGKLHYSYYYADIFTADKTYRFVRTAYSLSEKQKEKLVEQEKNTAAASAILSMLNVPYEGRDAEIFIPAFESIVKNHAQLLFNIYGSAAMETLVQYVSGVYAGILEDDARVLADIKTVLRIPETPLGAPAYEQSFFDGFDVWRVSVESTVLRLITMKTLTGDFTLTLRVLDDLNGKASFSVGAIVESVLRQYAAESVYASLPEGLEKDTAVTRWLDRWDVRIVMPSSRPDFLQTALRGTYTLSPDETAFFNRNSPLKLLFAHYQETDNQTAEVVVNPRLRRWLVPVYTAGTTEQYAKSIHDAVITHIPDHAQDARLSLFISDVSLNMQISSSSAQRGYGLPLDFERRVMRMIQVRKQDSVYAGIALPSDEVIRDIITTLSAYRITHPYAFMPDYPAEITVAVRPELNNLAYAAEHTAPERYPALFAVIGLEVEAQNAPILIPPYIVDMFMLDALIKKNENASEHDVSSIIGMPVSTPYVARHYKQIYELLMVHIEKLYNRYEIDFESEAFHEILLSALFSDIISAVARDFSAPDVIEYSLPHLVPEIARIAGMVYRDRLAAGDSENADILALSLLRKIEDTLARIEYEGMNHAFIPQADGLFVHMRVEQSYLAPVMDVMITRLIDAYYSVKWTPPAKPAASIVTALVSPAAKATAREYLRQTQILRNALSISHANERVTFLPVEQLPHDYFKDHSVSIRHEGFNLLERVPLLRVSSESNKPNLYSRLGAALWYHFHDELSEADRNAFLEEGDVLIPEKLQENIVGRITQLPLGHDTVEFSTQLSDFFRDYGYWERALVEYLTDVIAQKTARGDLTLSAKSIGSSIGKEAYSFAAMFNASLRNYARANLFQNITDSLAQNDAVERWVGLWDIKIFAIDSSPQRLIAAQEGVFLIGYSEINFFETHPEYKQIFSQFSIPDGAKDVGYAAVNPRVKSWIYPVYADLNTRQEVIADFPTEISFALNILPYLTIEPNAFIQQVVQSGNPPYKSLVMVNKEFGVSPVPVDALSGQHFTVPVALVPDYAVISSVVQKNGITDARRLAAFLGLPDSEVFRAELYFRMQNSVQTVVDSFENQSYSGLYSDDSTREFISNYLADAVAGILREIPDDARTVDMIGTYLSAFTQLAKSEIIARFGVSPDDAKRLEKQMSLWLDTVEVIDSENIFVPFNSHGHEVFMHHFIDRQPFSFDSNAVGTPVVKSLFVPLTAKEEFVRERTDMRATRELLAFIDFDELFVLWKKHRVILPHYIAHPNQIAALADTVARIVSPYAQELVQKYADELVQQYGVASRETLARYAAFLSNEPKRASPHPLVA
ncbi:hypothetical protein KDK77_02670, partial [bacterium]|nr:hypothetical protein [bacterium]